MTNERLIILGGGLAGLSACYHSNGVVYEKNELPGGHARSHHQDGFIFDEGIHVLHTNNEYILELLSKLDTKLQLRPRDARIVSNGVETRYPFQANTFGLPIDIVKNCLLGFIENPNNNLDNVNNYEDWIYYMFGKGIAEHFMIPYAEKFWGVEAKELTTDWVNIRHPKPTIEEVVTGALEDQSKRFGINGDYRYPIYRGFGKIAESLATNCGNRIKCNMRATKIDINEKKVTFNNKEDVYYDKILSSLPLPQLLELLEDVPNEVKNASKLLRTNSLYVINLSIKRENISQKNWIYFLEKEFCFVRVSFPFNQADSGLTPKGFSSIMVEISYGNNNPLPEDTEEKLVKRAISDLMKAKIINQTDEVNLVNTIDIKLGYVIFDKNRKQSVDIIHNYLKSINIIPFGRYGMWAYLWSDEAIMSGKNVIDEINQE